MSFNGYSLHEVVILQEIQFKWNGQNAVIKERDWRDKIKSSNVFKGILNSFHSSCTKKYFHA